MYLVGIRHDNFIEIDEERDVKEYVKDMIAEGYSQSDIRVYKAEQVCFEVKINAVEVVL